MGAYWIQMDTPWQCVQRSKIGVLPITKYLPVEVRVILECSGTFLESVYVIFVHMNDNNKEGMLN